MKGGSQRSSRAFDGKVVPDSRAVLDTLMQSSTVDLFHSCGLAVAPLDRARTKQDELRFHELTAAITFSAPRFSGSLALGIPQDTFALIRQDPTRPYSARDWVREMANQLLGRVKSRLLQFGVTLHTGLPSVISREALERTRQRGPMFSLYAFRTLRGEIAVTLSGDIDHKIFVYNGTVDVPSEGDILLF